MELQRKRQHHVTTLPRLVRDKDFIIKLKPTDVRTRIFEIIILWEDRPWTGVVGFPRTLGQIISVVISSTFLGYEILEEMG